MVAKGHLTGANIIDAFNDAKHIWPDSYEHEADLLKDVKTFLESLFRRGVVFLRISDRYTSGIPDILCCVQGKFVGIELKDNTGTASPQQEVLIARIRRVGGVAGVCRNVQDVVDLLNEAVGYECYRKGNRR